MPAFLLLLLLAPLLSGCVGIAVGALATGGVSIAEERSLGEQIDDLSITFDVSQRLNRFDGEIFSNVSVDVTEGRVLLAGNVAEPRHRVDAVRLAWLAEGVAEVSNELVVGESGSFAESLSDVVISNELRALLLFDSEISKLNFNVETVNGVVYLTGIAQDEAEHQRVLDTARTISGVEEVVSYVRVKGS